MWNAIKRMARKTASVVKRLVVTGPKNEYERLVFEAMFGAGEVIKRGWQPQPTRSKRTTKVRPA